MANSSREKIVIPVFNLFVKDIYFLHKIHTNHLPNGHINFKVSSAPLWSRGRGGCPSTEQGGPPGGPRQGRQDPPVQERSKAWPRGEGL